MTAYKDLIKLLSDYGIFDEKGLNKTANTYTHRGNLIQFFSMGDDAEDYEKIKSTNFNIIWMEEATDFSFQDYLTLQLRLRHPAPKGFKNRMVLSLNPIDENHWIPTELLKERDVKFIHSTFKDNPFLEKDYIEKRILPLKEQDPNWWRVYGEGEWGRLEDIIYDNWEEIPDFPEVKCWAYGLDFGYEAPTALVKVGVDYNGDVVVDQMVYSKKMTNADLIEQLTHVAKADCYADAAEPGRIEEIARAGWAIYGCDKGAGSVVKRIDLCKRHKIKITSRSGDVIAEIKGYHRKRERKTNLLLDEPVKYKDHAMNAMEYAVEGLVNRWGYATAEPGEEYTYVHKFLEN